MSVRIVPGEIGSKDVTTRTVLPSASRESLPPFERVAETIAAPRRRFPPHRHEGVEVLTYVTEGSASYVLGNNAPDPLAPGAVRLLTALTPVSHAINAGQGTPARWFATITTLPEGRPLQSRLQVGMASASDVQPDGTIVRRVVGPGAGLTSDVGLECTTFEFRENGTSFRQVGHDKVAVCYGLSGSGRVDNLVLEVGEAALIQDVAGVALTGTPGFHVVLISAPRSSAPRT